MFSGIENLESNKDDLHVLAGFAEHPFTPRSLALVQARLPSKVGVAYQNAMDFWSQIPAPSHFESLVGRPTKVFNVYLRNNSRRQHNNYPILAMQVELVEQWLRDALDEKSTTTKTELSSLISCPQTALALRCIRFHDAILMCLAGLYSVSAIGHGIEFRLTEVGTRSMTKRQWAMLFERMSQVSFRHYIHEVIQKLSPKLKDGNSIIDLIPEQLWQALEHLFMDRFFSFGSGVAESYPNSDAIYRVSAYCRWFAALEIVRQSGEGALRLTQHRIKSAGLDMSILMEIEENRRDAVYLDKGIYRQGDCLSLGELSLAHAIEVGKGVALPDSTYHEITQWLEESFTINYLQRYVRTEDYLVRGSLKRDAEHGQKRFDCDISIYDRRSDLFYFVQAKLRRASRMATASNEIRALTHKNLALNKGLDQITQMRKRISEASVIDALRSRFPELSIDASCMAMKSRFLVVHNIPEFNGLERDGVVMYEWNMFRNILARGRMAVSSNIENQHMFAPYRDAGEVLKIDDVDAVFEHYGKGLGLSKEFIETVFNEFANGQMNFTLPKTGSFFKKLFSYAPTVKAPFI